MTATFSQPDSAARAAKVEAVRQQLREIPETVDLEANSTPEALAAFEPEWPDLQG